MGYLSMIKLYQFPFIVGGLKYINCSVWAFFILPNVPLHYGE